MASQHQKRIKLTRIAVPLLAAILTLAQATPVAAVPAAPDSITLPKMYAFRNLVETGDFSLVFESGINYATPPTITANQAFIFQLLGTDGTTILGTSTPFNYHNSGYGLGASAFYFPAATAPTWGATYSIKITGNPAVFTGTIPSGVFVVTEATYTASTTQDDNQHELYTAVLTIANDLQSSWGSTYVMTTAGTTRTVLYQDGANYFRSAVPGIQSMSPYLFDTTLVAPDFSLTAWTTGQATTYEERLNGTWIGVAMTEFAGIFDMTAINFNTFIAVIGILALVGLSVYYDENRSPTPGLMAGLPIETCAVLTGSMPMGLPAVLSLCCVIFVSSIWFK